ncbi:hypothetical protein ILUMI_09982 [Ignelater luminosus]|uniref:Uncharacterized protein n=1 Tax=Ignelater luminosus TaxID=2038154 RepID=A0A8K0D357_IGNLU|nr:hypothetical protein ILUMI_09982 [Ignelater luminosus]
MTDNQWTKWAKDENPNSKRPLGRPPQRDGAKVGHQLPKRLNINKVGGTKLNQEEKEEESETAFLAGTWSMRI